MRAALYCRVSDPRQADNYSLGSQELACREYAAERGYTVAAVYHEIHTASEHYRSRPELTRMRELVRAGAVDVVIVYALDRYTRHQASLYILMEELETHGARLEIVTETLDSTPLGQLLLSVKAFVAAIHREQISERTSRGVQARIRSGKPKPGSRPPYGLLWADAGKTRWEVDPATVHIVVRIARECLDGIPLRSIAAGLTADGIPTPNGNAVWQPAVLSRMLRNPVYCGKPVGLHEQRRDGKRTLGWERGIPLADGIAPVVILPHDWQAIQARLRQNQQLAARNNRHTDAALFRGFVFCGHCGRRMYYTHDVRAPMYTCRAMALAAGQCRWHAITVARLDTYVWGRLQALVDTPELASVPPADQRAALSAEIAQIERARAAVARQVTTLIRELATAPTATRAASIREVLDQLDAQQSAHDARIAALHAAIDATERQTADAGNRAAWLATLRDQSDGWSFAERQIAFAQLGLRVLVYRRGHSPRITIMFGDGVTSSNGNTLSHYVAGFVEDDEV